VDLPFRNSQGDIRGTHVATIQGWLHSSVWAHVRIDDLEAVARLHEVPPQVDGPNPDEPLVPLFSLPDPRAAVYLVGPLALLEIDPQVLDPGTARIGWVIDDGQRVRVGERLGSDLSGSVDLVAQLASGGDELVLLVPRVPLGSVRVIHHPTTLPSRSKPGQAIARIAESCGGSITAGGDAMERIRPKAQRRAEQNRRRRQSH